SLARFNLFTDRVAQSGNLLHTLGHRLDSALVQRESFEEGSRPSMAARAIQIVRIGLENRAARGPNNLRQREQRGILLLRLGERELAPGRPRSREHGYHVGFKAHPISFSSTKLSRWIISSATL